MNIKKTTSPVASSSIKNTVIITLPDIKKRCDRIAVAIHPTLITRCHKEFPAIIR